LLMLEANNTVDPFLPKPGSGLVIPSQMLLPDTPPFETDGRLVAKINSNKGSVYDYRGFNGRIGESDIHGSLTYSQGKPRPKLEGDLESRQLRLADLGPLINERAVEKVERLVRDAKEQGARVLTGGERINRPGYFFQPTVLANVSTNMALTCEEIFGPVVAIQKFATEDEAVRLANDTPYGLAAYACTTDQKRIYRLSSALEAGMIGFNEGAISSEVAPFGGIKQSGYGREGSTHGLDDYQSIKYVCIGGLT